MRHKDEVFKTLNRIKESNPSMSVLIKEMYKEFCAQFEDLAKQNESYADDAPFNVTSSCFSSLEEAQKTPLKAAIKEKFDLIKPELVRSGQAVRMLGMNDRIYNDYIWYLRMLICEMKSLYPDLIEANDLEILAQLQHKGAATCLVDFSTNFLVGLWFATQDYARAVEEKTTGFLLCYDIITDSFLNHKLKFLCEPDSSLPIDSLLPPTKFRKSYSGADTHHFWVWKPSNYNSRIARQDSVFIFGIEKFVIDEHSVLILPIPSYRKGPIQRVLRSLFGITPESLFGDRDGYASSNTKFDPIKFPEKYFNMPHTYRREDRDSLYQLGISSMLNSQYEVSLNYFNAVQRDIDRVLSSKTSKIQERTNAIVLRVEILYNLGFCYKKLAQSTGLKNDCVRFENCAIHNLESACDFIVEVLGGTNNRYLKIPLNVKEQLKDKLLTDVMESLFGIYYDRFDFSSIKNKLVSINELFKNDNKAQKFLDNVALELIILNRLSGNEDFEELDHCYNKLSNSLNNGTINEGILMALWSYLYLCLEPDSEYESEKALTELYRRIDEVSNPNYKKPNHQFLEYWSLEDVKKAMDKASNEIVDPAVRKKMSEVLMRADECQRTLVNMNSFEM